MAADHVAAMVLEHSSEAYGALEELTPARIGDGTNILLRVGQEATVKAAVRTQDGSIIEGADLVWSIDEEEEGISVEDGVITALASNYDADDGYSPSMVSFKSPTHLVAGELSVNVSNAVAKVKLSKDSLIPLAIGETTKITASALDSDDKAVPNLGAMGNYEWASDTGSAGVGADKHPKGHEMAGKFVMAAGAAATISGKSSGDATISATIEGSSASVDISVSGSSITRDIIYTEPETRTFTWERDQATAAWKDGNTSTTFTVELYNAISDARIDGFDENALGVTVTSGNKAETVGLVATETAAGGVVTVTVTAQNFDDSDPIANDGSAPIANGPVGIGADGAESKNYIVELKVNGAVSKRIHFTVAITAPLDS